eukprot:607761-Amphidinium_carterae.1
MPSSFQPEVNGPKAGQTEMNPRHAGRLCEIAAAAAAAADDDDDDDDDMTTTFCRSCTQTRRIDQY